MEGNKVGANLVIVKDEMSQLRKIEFCCRNNVVGGNQGLKLLVS
jgi:hypothetical protein